MGFDGFDETVEFPTGIVGQVNKRSDFALQVRINFSGIGQPFKGFITGRVCINKKLDKFRFVAPSSITFDNIG